MTIGEKLVSFFTLCMFYAACSNNPSIPTFDRNQVADDIKMMTDSFHHAIAENGFASEFDFLDSSDQFFWVIPGERQALYYDTIRSLIMNNHKAFTDIDLSWELLNIHPLSDSMASYNGVIKGSMKNISNDSTSLVRILESGIFIKRQSGWKFLCGQSRSAISEP